MEPAKIYCFDILDVNIAIHMGLLYRTEIKAIF